MRTDCGARRVHGARQAAGVQQLLYFSHFVGYGRIQFGPALDRVLQCLEDILGQPLLHRAVIEDIASE